MKNNENKIESRRSFLKKAAYAVPTVIAISQITNPVTAAAAPSGSVIQGNQVSNINPTVMTGAGQTDSTGGTDTSEFNALKSFSSSINN